MQMRRHNIDVRIGIEIFKDFDIDIDFRKNYQETNSLVFKNKIFDVATNEAKFIETAGYTFGSYESTYSGLSSRYRLE